MNSLFHEAAPQRRTTADLATALARLGPGAATLYRQLYVTFRADIRPMIEEAASLVGAARMDDARRLLHTIQGIAATMGATCLVDAAQRARCAVAGGMTGAQPQPLQQVRSAFVQACREIEASMGLLDGAMHGHDATA